MSRFLKDSAMSFGAECLQQCLAFGTSVVTSWALGPTGRGLYALAFGFASLSVNVFSLRWDRPTAHFLGKDSTNLPTVIWTNLAILGLAPMLALLTWTLFPVVITDFLLKHAPARIIAISIAMMCVTSLLQTVSAILAGLRLFAWRAIFLIVGATITFTPVAVLYGCGIRARSDDSNHHTVATFLTVNLFVSGSVYAIWFVLLCRALGMRMQFNKATAWSMARYGVATYPSLLLNLMAIRLDMFILAALATAYDVGLYSITIAIVNTLLIAPTIVSTVLFARVSANESGSPETTARLLRLILWSMLAGAVIVAIVATFLVAPVYGHEFAAAVPPLYVMLPATAALGTFRVVSSYLEGHGAAGSASICSLAAAVTVVTLDLFLIPRFGIMGLAWGALIGQSVALVTALVVFHRITKIKMNDLWLPRVSDFTLLTQVMRRAALPKAGNLAQ